MKRLCLMILLCFLRNAYAEKLSVSLDWFANPNHISLIAAKQLGFFKRYDLDVQLLEPTSAITPQLIASKQIDLGVSYQPQLYVFTEENLPLVRIATLIDKPLNILLTRKDSNIHTLADLKGKTIGFSTAGVDELMVSAMLKSVHLSLDDVILRNVNFALTTALLSKQVDAVTGAMANYQPFELEAQGVAAQQFAVVEHGIPSYDEIIIIAHKDHVNEPRVQKFVQALTQTHQYLKAHPKKAWEALIAYKSELNDPINQTSLTATLPVLTTDPNDFDEQKYQAYGQFLKERGIIKTLPKTEDLAIRVIP